MGSRCQFSAVRLTTEEEWGGVTQCSMADDGGRVGLTKKRREGFFYLVKKYKNTGLWELLSHQARREGKKAQQITAPTGTDDKRVPLEIFVHRFGELESPFGAEKPSVAT